MPLSGNEQQKQQNKSMEPIRVTREAEDYMPSRNIELQPLEMGEMQQSDRTISDEKANPLIKRELMRRMNSAIHSDKADPEMNAMLNDINENNFVSLEQRAEKSWVSTQMKEYQQRIEARNEAARQEELRRQQEKQQYEREHTTDVNSESLQRSIDKARQKLGRKAAEKSRLEHVPERSLLMKEYKGKFSDRIDMRVRKEKQTNRRSRLFQKQRNKLDLQNALERSENDRMKLMNESLKKTGQSKLCTAEDYTDLSYFMEQSEENANVEIIQKYLGKSKKEGAGGREGQDTQRALDMMAEQLFSIDISSLNFETDAEMVKNAEKLEKLSGQVAAFDRMSDKHNYIDNLNPEMKRVVESRMSSLRAIAAYYNIRKDIISDSLYSTRYNDELSMDILGAKNDQQRALAEKLVRSYILGKNMMALNGVELKRIAKRGDLKFSNSDMQGIYKNMELEYKDKKFMKDTLQNGHRLKEANAGSELAKLKVELKEDREERLKENKVLVEQAEQNILSYEGNLKQESGVAVPVYSDEKLEADIEELKALPATAVKFGSYEEIVNNYAKNLKVCDRVEEVQHNLVRGLTRGYKVDDELMLDLRAKFIFFHSVRNTSVVFNGFMAGNSEFAQKSKKEWEQTLWDNISKSMGVGMNNNITLYPGDADRLLSDCRKRVTDEFNTREETIKASWKFMYSTVKVTKNSEGDDVDEIIPGGEIPAEELEKRKKEYNSNSVIGEFLHDQYDNQTAGNVSKYVTSTYLKKNNLKSPTIPRVALNFLIGKSAEETLRLYKLITGTKGEQFMYWCEMAKKALSLPVKSFETNDMGAWFDNFYKNQGVTGLHGNCTDIYTEMKALLDDPSLKGQLKLPQEYRDMEDFRKKMYLMYNFGSTYTTGRVNALTQTPQSRWRGVFSLQELGSMSKEYAAQFMELDTSLKGLDENEYYESQEVLNLQKILQQGTMFITPDIATRPLTKEEKKAGKLQEKASFDTNLEELYKEEEAFYDIQREKELKNEKMAEIRKINKDIDEKLHLRSKKMDDSSRVNKEEWGKKHFSHSTRGRHVVRSVNGMAYFYNDTEERSLQMYERLMRDVRVLDSKEKQEKAREYERIFFKLLTFDMKKFNFDDPKELLSPKRMDARILTNVMFDFPEDFIDDYENIANDPDAGAVLTPEQIKEVRSRWSTLFKVKTWYSDYPELMGNKAFENENIDEMLKQSPDELEKLLEDKKDPDYIAGIINMITITTIIQKGFRAGVDANELLQKEREAYGLSGVDEKTNINKAAEAIWNAQNQNQN